MHGGSSTFASTSNAIRDCCGGPSNLRVQRRAADVTIVGCELAQKSATLGSQGRCTRTREPCDVVQLQRSATLGRQSRNPCNKDTCDVIQSGIQQSDKILWRFDCDIAANNPDVTHRTETIETRTTTL